MEQFFLEHTFVGMVPYAIIAGVLLAFAIGGVITAIREIKYYLEDKGLIKTDELGD